MFVSPEFSKVIVNWPKENLKLSIHTPISFEHDFLEDKSVAPFKGPSSELLAQVVKKGDGSTVWNAKIILMSGLSRNSLEELSSDKIYDDHVPHICNILRFALLKRDHSLMAIGGPWDPADGGDPSFGDSALIQTALRYAKDVTQLDLQHCHNWNRFLEIHYDRIGKDGFFSHKEVTVLFVPDLSECLPSLDAWREQWLAHKKVITERERRFSLKKERLKENKEEQKDKGTDSIKDSKRVKTENIKESATSVVNKKEKEGFDVKDKVTSQKGDGNETKLEKQDGTGMVEAAKNAKKKEQGESTSAQAGNVVKSGKKKIIRRIVKQKITGKKPDAENATSKPNDTLDEDGGKTERSEISVQQNESSTVPSGIRTFVRKKVVKKIPVGKTSQNEDKSLQPEVKAESEMGCTEDKPMDTSNVAISQGSSVKTAIKKKIIKRVLKRKLASAVADENKEDNKDNKEEIKVDNEKENNGKQTADAEKEACELKNLEKIISKVKSESPSAEKQVSALNSNKTEIKAAKEDKKDEKETAGKNGLASKGKAEKQKVAQKDDQSDKRGKSKDDEKLKDEKRDKEGKNEFRSKTNNKEVKRKPEETQKHPGMFLQTKVNKDTKVRSLSLSMDSLLEYTDKDIEESTFEISLFAESLYEMLQYQMGCRLLTFLQKLRSKFVMKRNQLKRQRDNMDEDKNKSLSAKRRKTRELPVKLKSTNSEMSTDQQPGDQNAMSKEDTSTVNVNGAKLDEETNDANEAKLEETDDANEANLEEGTDEDEDPEEDPEEYEEIEDNGSDASSETNKEEEKTDEDAKHESVTGNEKEVVEEAGKEKTSAKVAEAKPKSDAVCEDRDAKVEAGKKEPSTVKEPLINKELLQAFRFFDRNRAGYVRVEDMRLIIHSLGKFLSHRDVKEIVQSALLESNTGRDDRILYKKLVRMIDI